MADIEHVLRDPGLLYAAADADRAQGNVLAAFDLVQQGREQGTRSQALDYLLVRLTTELGDYDGAMRLYDHLRLHDHDAVDLLALKGRILKDKAFLAEGRQRADLLNQAGEAYRRAHHVSGAYYPAINAASLMMLAGRSDDARQLAAAVREAIAASDSADYWALASDLEACILLGDAAAIDQASARLRCVTGVAFADRASTIRQFRRLSGCPAIDAARVDPVIEMLRPPPVLVYCGHMFLEGCSAEADLRLRIDAVLDDLGTCIAYGPLACGADILIAEAILARGGELTVVLPFKEADFVDQSVRCGGAGWETRYRACIARADDVVLATEAAFVGDDHQFAYGTRVAMGLAEIRARQLETRAVHLAVLSDDAAALVRSKIAGTQADMALWNALGRTSVVVEAGPVDRALDFPPARTDDDAPEGGAYSILFADYKGFSRLGERELPAFASKIMGAIGDVLDAFGDDILFRNTWGDAVYAVISTPSIAARVAILIQERLAKPPVELQHDPTAGAMGMRIGVHHGPIYKGFDRVVKQPLWFGTEVTRTARIEPVTPIGAVYCTEAFAAMLMLESADAFSQYYVGRVALAKGYGEIGMYRLARLRS
jgi:adenylate cyclase